MRSFRLGVPGLRIGVAAAAGLVAVLCAAPANAAVSLTELTSDLNFDGSLYGIDANSASTTGPFHAPIGYRVGNTTGATITPLVLLTITNVSSNGGNPCAFLNSVGSTPSTFPQTATLSGIPISNNSTYDYYFDIQFQRDTGCADKNNAHRNFTYRIDVFSPASNYPSGSVAATHTSGITPIVGLSDQGNDTAGFTSCVDGLGHPMVPVNTVYEVSVNQEFTCTFSWSTSSSNFDGVRVWQDWLGQFFEITKVNSNYPTWPPDPNGTFPTPTGTFSPDCLLNGGCGSGGKSNLYSQVVSVRALAQTTAAPAVACPAVYGSSSFCTSITSTTYDETAAGTHYVSATSPPIFTVKNTPTAVKLRSFEATRSGEDTLLSWKTGREVNNLGFRVYRDSPSGERVVVTPELIAGNVLFAGQHVDLTSGNSYHFLDRGAPAGATYTLEDIDISGASTLSSPVTVREVESPTVLGLGAAETMSTTRNSPSVSDVAPRSSIGIQTPEGFSAGPHGTGQSEMLAAKASKASAQNAQFSIASEVGIKISVREEGWYRITRQDLQTAGWDPGSTPDRLQLYVEGTPIPMLVTDLGGGNYSLEFYGSGLDTTSTDTRVYWLELNPMPGSRMANKNSAGGSSPGADFPFTVGRKDRVIYVPGILNGDAESWYGPIVWPSWSTPVNQSVNVTHLDTLAGGSATLDLAVETATADVLHTIDVSVNGNPAGTLTNFGQGHFESTLSIPVSWLVEGSNTITLQEEGNSNFSLMDYVDLTYPHLFKADSDALAFTVAGSKRVTISGFSIPGVRVFDVTNPSAVIMLSKSVGPDGAGGYAVTFSTPSAVGNLDLLAIADDRVSSPAALDLNAPSSLNKKSNSADFVLISHPSFLSTLGPLQTLRQAQGLATQIVDLTDVYDEFSFGEKDPAAIKAFLQTAKANWKKAPKYVLLVGDGSYDPRDYFGIGTTDFVPAKLVSTAFLKTASDDWYVDFNNDSLPDMAIGRLPAEDPADAATMISKIVSYESASPSSSVLLVADHEDDNDFHGEISVLKNLVGNGKTAQAICIDPDPVDPSYPNIGPCVNASTAHNQIIDAFNSGQSVVNWVGHGEPTSWSQQNVFDTSDVPGLSNSAHLPFALTMDCLNGYFHDPKTESFAESLLRAPSGGAVAVWASSSLTLFESQVPVNQTLFQLLFTTSAPRLGDAIRTAKGVTADSDVRKTWILFGDPTMKLK